MTARIRNVAFVLLGVAGLLLRARYTGPLREIVRGYGGNVAVSFAVYFILIHLFLHSRFRRLAAAGLALAAVELFEAANGFQLMSNTYDPADFLANAAGIALALLVDAVASGPRPTTCRR